MSPKVQTHVSKSLPYISTCMLNSCLKYPCPQMILLTQPAPSTASSISIYCNFIILGASGRKLGSHPWPLSCSYTSHSIHQEILLALLPNTYRIEFFLTTPTATSMSKLLSSFNWTIATASGNNPGNQGNTMSISSPVHFDGAAISSGCPKRF